MAYMCLRIAAIVLFSLSGHLPPVVGEDFLPQVTKNYEARNVAYIRTIPLESRLKCVLLFTFSELG
jgi:hypothetical protein